MRLHATADQSGRVPWAVPYVTRGIISFAFVLAGAMFFSVGALLCWHLYLVSTAQTSVELLINREMAADARLRGEVRLRAHRSARQADGPVTQPPGLLVLRLGQVFTNEYDLGVRRNLLVFFNVCDA